MTMPEPDPDPRQTMAAELALGVLEGEERAAALRRVLAEPDFARDVETWRAHFATLLLQLPAVEVPAGLEGRIAARIEGRPAPTSVRMWRTIAGVATAMAACLALFVATRPAPPPAIAPFAAPAPLVAAMTPTAKGAPVSAVYDRATGEVRVAAASLAPAGKSAQLWAIAADGVPHSLGLLRGAGTTMIRLDAVSRARLVPGVTLAVSVEPEGGSPTALPTGPVVAGGALTSV